MQTNVIRRIIWTLWAVWNRAWSFWRLGIRAGIRHPAEVSITHQPLPQLQPFANLAFNVALSLIDRGVSGSRRPAPPCSCISSVWRWSCRQSRAPKWRGAWWGHSMALARSLDSSGAPENQNLLWLVYSTTFTLKKKHWGWIWVTRFKTFHNEMFKQLLGKSSK